MAGHPIASQLNFVVMDSGLDASHRPGMTAEELQARDYRARNDDGGMGSARSGPGRREEGLQARDVTVVDSGMGLLAQASPPLVIPQCASPPDFVIPGRSTWRFFVVPGALEQLPPPSFRDAHLGPTSSFRDARSAGLRCAIAHRGIHNHHCRCGAKLGPQRHSQCTPVVMDSGLDASHRPGMTTVGLQARDYRTQNDGGGMGSARSAAPE
jgi:hypothetical protein